MRPVPRDAGIQKVDRVGGHAGLGKVSLSIDRLSTERAEFENRIHGFIAAPASTVRDDIQCLATSIACQHGQALFDPQKRDKEQTEVMIGALVMSCFQAAAGTNPRVFIKRFGFGLNTCDEKHVDIAPRTSLACKSPPGRAGQKDATG